MTELEHLQKVILSLTKDIDRLCRANNIQYYLLGGSCIGAIRHKGFIPWDDDLDIIMSRENYDKFLQICNKELNKEKYYLQEGLKDWPLNFSKIRLKDTYLHEPEDDYAPTDKHGIYVDIFFMENVPDSNFLSSIQYFLSKVNLCYLLSKRKYLSASKKQKILMILSAPMKVDIIRKWVYKILKNLSKKPSSRYGFYYGRTRFRTSITPKSIFGIPKYVQFEDTTLPVPEKTHEYLTQMFGDYMKLPPENQRKGQHLLSVDFGKY
ncbi:MAG: LicD family protein [Clostridia bacterium]|nr:LicD family protein [Clostridia bacterium]